MQKFTKDTERFLFESIGCQDIRFYVIRFTGTEAINALFSFKIELVCSDASFDITKMVNSMAFFTMLRENGEHAVFMGYPSKVENHGYIKKYLYLTVELRPAFGKLTQIIGNTIFLDKDLKQTIEELMTSEKYFHFDYEFRFMSKYAKKEFALQYNESIFNYILRRLEEQGAYFFFDQNSDKIIFTDMPQAHNKSIAAFLYAPPTGLEEIVKEEVITSFILSQKPVPAQVVVRNYDWTDPTRMLVGIAEVSQLGNGDVYLSNEEVASEEEAKRIAQIRAEQILTASRVFHGTSMIPHLRPGFVFTLDRYFDAKFNRDYLVTEITHEGAQETFITLGLGIQLSETDNHYFYRNTFYCVESDVKYRPAQKLPRPVISGMINAFIDGDNASEPLMDKYGRYKIIFPFDLSKRSEGKASCWIRRAQEQVGKDFGVAFPLQPGTEVLISFVNGNPDYPVITGALANGETGSISGAGNRSVSGIRTSGGPQLLFDNKHNEVSLLNLSGSGISFGSGSLDCTQVDSHIGLSNAAAGTSTLTGFFTDNMAGFISFDGAWCGNIAKYLFAAISAGLKAGAIAFDKSCSSKSTDPDAPKIDWGASIDKIYAVIQTFAFANKKFYNVVIEGEKKSACTYLQCCPSKFEVFGNIVVALLARIADVAVKAIDVSKKGKEMDNRTKDNEKDMNQFKTTMKDCMQAVYDAGVHHECAKYEKDKGEYYKKIDKEACGCYADTKSAMESSIRYYEEKLKCDCSTENRELWTKKVNTLREKSIDLELYYKKSCIGGKSKKDYYATYKKEVRRNLIKTQLASFLPELIAMITLGYWRTGREKKQMGGVQIVSKDKNINLQAHTYVGFHAGRGIFLNTYNNDLTEEVVTNWGSPYIEEPRTNTITSIFTKINEQKIKVKKRSDNSVDKKKIGEFMSLGHTNRRKSSLKFYSSDWGNGVDIPNNTFLSTFIAGQTSVYYMESKASFHYSLQKWVSIAPEHRIQPEINNPEAYITIKKFVQDNQPVADIELQAKKDISIICGANSEAIAMSYFSVGEKNVTAWNKAGTTSIVNILDDSVELKSGNSDGSQVILDKNGASFLVVQSGVVKTSIVLQNGVVTIKAKDIYLDVARDNQDNASNGGIVLSNITRTQTGTFVLQNGALKVTDLSTATVAHKVRAIKRKIKALRENENLAEKAKIAVVKSNENLFG